MHVGRMEARYVVRRRHGLRIEERRQLVVLLGEAGPAVELALEPQRLAAELGEEVLRQGRAVRGIDCVGEELRVGLGDRTAEDAEAARISASTSVMNFTSPKRPRPASMSTPIMPPSSIVSTPRSLATKLSWARSSGSVRPQFDPSRPSVSYSTGDTTSLPLAS